MLVCLSVSPLLDYRVNYETFLFHWLYGLNGFDTITQISIKYAGDQALPFELSTNWLGRLFGQPWIYGAVVGYIGAFFTWITLLKRAPIGQPLLLHTWKSFLCWCFLPFCLTKILVGLK